MINNNPSAPVTKLPSDTGTIYVPAGEWTYSHHASLTYFAGSFRAVWSNGRRDEDSCGQRVLMACSADGLHWEEPFVLAAPEQLGDAKAVLTSCGTHIHEGTLYAYFGFFRYEEDCLTGPEKDQRPYTGGRLRDTALYERHTTDGVCWSEPRPVGPALVANHGPQPTRSGRLIFSGNVLFPYADDPSGMEGWHITGIYGDAFGTAKPVDNYASIGPVSVARGWDTLLCEGSFFQTDDDVLHMMLRSNGEHLWVTESRDDGETWSDPVPTGYTDDGTKFHFGRLPDGRFYGVSNPVYRSPRLPLSICLSRDGENFDTQYILRDEPRELRYEGMHKGGVYGYPHTLIRDGYLYVIYSVIKENIEVTRLKLEQL